MPTPEQSATLAALTEKLKEARHGERRKLKQAAAAEMKVTPQTVYRWLKNGGYCSSIRRKLRSDTGPLWSVLR